MQSKWKDIVTEISLHATGFNPEILPARAAGVWVPVARAGSWRFPAYDSVKAKLFSLIRSPMNSSEDASGSDRDWQIYVTGHTLGGALATLVALDLAYSKLAK